MKVLHGLVLAALVFAISGCRGRSGNSVPVHDLKMIADQPLMVIWANPGQHLKNPAAAELFKAILKTAPEGEGEAMAAAIPKIDSLKLSMNPGKLYYSDREAPVPVVVMHLTDSAAATSMFEMMTERQKPRTTSELAKPIYQHDYSYPGDPNASKDEEKWQLKSGTTQLDPQTIASGETTEKLIAVATAKEPAKAGAWASDFQNLASSQSLLLVDTAKLRALLDEELMIHPPRAGTLEAMIFEVAKPLWEESDYAFLTLDTQDGIKVTGLAKSASPEAATKFKGALEALIGMGKGSMPLLKPLVSRIKGKSAEETDKLYKELETAVNSLTITQDGATTKLALNIKQDAVNQFVKGIFLPMLEQEQNRRSELNQRVKERSQQAIEMQKALIDTGEKIIQTVLPEK